MQSLLNNKSVCTCKENLAWLEATQKIRPTSNKVANKRKLKQTSLTYFKICSMLPKKMRTMPRYKAQLKEERWTYLIYEFLLRIKLKIKHINILNKASFWYVYNRGKLIKNKKNKAIDLKEL